MKVLHTNLQGIILSHSIQRQKENNKAVLNAIPIYWMSMYILPVKVRKRIKQLSRRLL
jgi:hypothetical protein